MFVRRLVTPANTDGRSVRVVVRDLVIIVLIALVASILIKTFLVRSFYIPSSSMENTLMVNDRIVVNQLEPRLSPVSRGDVVVFEDPGGWLTQDSTHPPDGDPIAAAGTWVLEALGLAADDANDHLIKRVIGLPGDHVVCCSADGEITVNGVPIDEGSYLRPVPGSAAPGAASALDFDVVVPGDRLWVMGDNRDNSQDSRFHQDDPGGGFVPFDDVTGRAFLITWPLNRWNWLDNHPSVFSAVPDPR